MAAKDSLGEQFLYHGTTHDFKPGDELLPQGHTLHGPSTGKHVYMTDQDTAQEYAGFAIEQLADMGHSGPLVPRVFKVKPVGEVEEDPAGLRQYDDDDNEYTTDRRAPKAIIVEKTWEGEPWRRQ